MILDGQYPSSQIDIKREIKDSDCTWQTAEEQPAEGIFGLCRGFTQNLCLCMSMYLPKTYFSLCSTRFEASQEEFVGRL